MTTGIVFRTAGPWGPGKGSNLTPTEVDENFDHLHQRVLVIELNPPLPIEITSITVVGSAMTINMGDGSKFGPFTLPVATFVFRGNWAPLTNYFVNDTFLEPGDGLYVVVTDYQSATAFDPFGVEVVKMVPDTNIVTLDDVGDVEYPTGLPAIGDALVYRGTTGIWTPEPLVGRQTIWMPAAFMRPTVTAGAGSHNTDAGLVTVELTVGRPNITHLPFDHVTEQNAQFSIAMPKSQNLGGIKYRAIYSHAGGQATGSDGVAWGLSAVAVGDAESIDVVFGTEVIVTKDAATSDTEHATAESATVTPAGTLSKSDEWYFNLARKVGEAADDLDIEARLHGLLIFYDSDRATDD